MCLCCLLVLDHALLCRSIYLRGILLGGLPTIFYRQIASSHFHVIEYVDVDSLCVGVEIYSFETAAWIYKESEWGQDIDDVICSRSTIVFLMVVCTLWGGKTWRKIPRPRGTLPSNHQAQGHLCVCTVGGVSGHNMSLLFVWILEDYATNKWTLKHTVSTLKVFRKTNI